jgi:SAM-dependent methyltransferase
MIRNERDIIEPFIRHHARLMDLMFVLDNRSTDGSRQILQRLGRELGNVIVIDCPDEGYNQTQIMTAALREIQAVVQADFVFLLDADEFLPVPDTGALHAALSEAPVGGMALLPWKTFVPHPDADETAEPEPFDRLRLVRTTEDPQYVKAVLRAGGNVVPDLQVSQGCHAILDHYGAPLPSRVLPGLPLLHFPLRSTEQLAAKGLIGWQSNLRRRSIDPSLNEAAQWKRLHDLVQAGHRPSPADLHDEAVRYAQDGAADTREASHGIRPERRYSDGSFADASRLLAEAQAFVPDVMPIPARPEAALTMTDIANAFDSAWHWDLFFLDVPPIRWIIEFLQPGSILDLGCGSGIYPRLYQHLGVADVLGVDGLDLSATVLTADTYREADLQQPFDAGRRFDLVICLEVLEHLFPERSDVLLDTIAAHATETILFSMAEPGQPGNGHINCLTMDAVLAHWEARGWYPNLAQTLGLRAISTMSWFRRNILVLKRQPDSRHPDAAALLRQIGALPYEWYGQEPGMRAFAFQEEARGLTLGYGLRVKQDN